MSAQSSLASTLDRYRSELFDSVVPFWLEHAIDTEHGGLFSCIGDDGVVQSTDKYMWSQLRALWTYSALHNRMGASAAAHAESRRAAGREPNDSRAPKRPIGAPGAPDGTDPQAWLDVAHGLFRFVSRFGRDEQDRWVFARQGDGSPHTGYTSIYTDGFAILGLTEYARATGNTEALAAARDTYARVRDLLARPGSYPADPYPLPEGVKAHGISMIFSLAFFELALLTGDEEIMGAAVEQAEQVMGVFRRPDQGYVLEFMGLDDQVLDSQRGRAIVPGHAIESMWFMIHIYQHVGNEQRVREAIDAIRWHVELGWDEEYGGLMLGRDAMGGESWWPFSDAKIWWPHTEALYALLLAFELSGEEWSLEWFERMDAYSFANYPVAEHGEWTQRLDRYGTKFSETVALPVKDPFHLPRALIYSIQSLERLVEAQPKANV